MLKKYKVILLILVTSLISLVYIPSYRTSYATTLQEKIRIITGSAIRLRSAPQTTASEVTRLSIGTLVKEIGKSDKKEKIGQQEDFWYQVVLADGKQGWVFGGFAEAFEESKKGQIYTKLIDDRLKAKTSFSDQVDLVNFLERTIKEVKTPEVIAELELGYLLALRQSVHSIPVDKQSDAQYKNWLKKHESKLVYSEPSGEWEIQSEQLWNLQKKYSSLAVGEKIAWEASQNTLPGECEGYLPCYISILGLTSASYLQLYPTGAHSQEALKTIADEIDTYVEDMDKKEPTYTFPNDAETRKDLQDSLAEVRKKLSGLPAAKTSSLFKQMDKIAQKFR